LRLLENGVLRRMFGPKREEVAGGLRRLHNKRHNLHASPNVVRGMKSRRMRWTVHVVRVGEIRSAYKILIGKPERKGLLGRPRRRWEDNIRMDLREIGWEIVDWMHLAQDRDQWQVLVKTVMSFRVP
jgi:hypothetical protein